MIVRKKKKKNDNEKNF